MQYSKAILITGTTVIERQRCVHSHVQKQLMPMRGMWLLPKTGVPENV
jgi:hypothetical protein